MPWHNLSNGGGRDDDRQGAGGDKDGGGVGLYMVFYAKLATRDVDEMPFSRRKLLAATWNGHRTLQCKQANIEQQHRASERRRTGAARRYRGVKVELRHM